MAVRSTGPGVMQLQNPLQQGRFGNDLLDEVASVCCTRLSATIWAISRCRTKALIRCHTAAGRRGPPGSCLGQRLAAGQDLSSASTWLTTFSKTMSMRVRRSCCLTGRIGQIGATAAQVVTGAMATVSTVRVWRARSKGGSGPLDWLPGREAVSSSLGVREGARWRCGYSSACSVP